MARRNLTQPIDRLSAADSVLSLLGALKPERIPRDERIALANVQIEFGEEWFSASMELAATGAAERATRPSRASSDANSSQ